MPRTPDRSDGDRDETATVYEDTTPTVTTVEGELRYSGGQFRFRDAAGEYDPRVGQDEQVKVTGADTTPGTLDEKLIVSGAGISKSVQNPAADEDLQVAIATAAPAAASLGTTPSEGAANSLARSDHVHQSNTAPVNVTKAAAVIGTSGEPARADHKHDVSTAAPVSLPPDQANAEGSSTALARADHVHLVPAGIPTTQTPDQANDEGAAAFFARSDHTHNIPAEPAVTLTPDAGNQEGVAASFARSDHVHDVPAAAPPTLGAGGANAEGSAASFARSDHVHRIADPSTEVSATGSILTTSSTPTIATGMTITPSAGTYLVWFSSWGGHSNNNARLAIAIGVAGTIAPNSTREVGGTNQSDGMVFNLSTQARVTVNGSQAIQGGYWRSTGGGSVVLFDRTLTILKVDG